MDQHVCLFYLADKLSVEKLQGFYSRMCKALGYSDDKKKAYYILYGKQYNLFQGEEITPTLQKRFDRLAACSDCHALCSNKSYKAFQIEDNACVLCRLSSLYRNGRIQDEAIVLNRFMDPKVPFCGNLFLNSSLAFYSCVRVCKDYAVGSYPIITLYAFLYDFICQENGYGNRTREEFLNDFVNFICTQTNILSGQTLSQTDFMKLVSFHLERIYGIKPTSITDDLFEIKVAELKEFYVYEPPVVMHGEEVVSDSSGKTSRESNCDSVSLLDSLSSPEDEKESSSAPAGSLPGSADLEPGTELSGDDFDGMYGDYYGCDIEAPDEESIPASCFTGRSFEENEELVGAPWDSSSPESESEPDTLHEQPCSEAVEADQPLSSSVKQVSAPVLSVSIDISDDSFRDVVLYVSESVSHDFSTSVYQSDFVSMEPACFFGRYGLLVYVSHNDVLYFYDTSVYGADGLVSLLEAEQLDVYTAHSLAVYVILIRNGSSCCPIIPLDLICEDGGVEMVSLETVKGMKNYHQNYLGVKEKLNHPDVLQQVQQMLLVYRRLARIDYLSVINPELSSNLLVNEDGKYSFRYSLDTDICVPGVLFMIGFDKACLSELCPGSFLSECLLTIDSLPYVHRKKIFVLKFSEDSIYLFYQGALPDAQKCYDLFMARIQRIYLRSKKEPLKSSTICYIYSNPNT